MYTLLLTAISLSTVVRGVLRNNYQSRNLIGPYHFWGISPRNSTSFTGSLLARRRTRAGHETTIGQTLLSRQLCEIY